MNRISAIAKKIASQLRVAVPSSCRRILRNPALALNLRRICEDISEGRDIENLFHLECLTCRKPPASPHRFPHQQPRRKNQRAARSYRLRYFPRSAFWSRWSRFSWACPARGTSRFPPAFKSATPIRRRDARAGLQVRVQAARRARPPVRPRPSGSGRRSAPGSARAGL